MTQLYLIAIRSSSAKKIAAQFEEVDTLRSLVDSDKLIGAPIPHNQL